MVWLYKWGGIRVGRRDGLLWNDEGDGDDDD